MVLIPRRWYQALKKLTLLMGDGDNKARSPGRARRKPLKPAARGMPGETGVTVVTMLVCLFHFAYEAAGAGSARHSLRPLISRSERFLHNSGANHAAGNKKACLRMSHIVAPTNAATHTPCRIC